MSRGLQMLVEEGSVPHALMLCGPSGSKTCHGFHQKNGKNRLSSTDDEPKIANSAFHPRMTSEKQQNLRFVPLR